MKELRTRDNGSEWAGPFAPLQGIDQYGLVHGQNSSRMRFNGTLAYHSPDRARRCGMGVWNGTQEITESPYRKCFITHERTASLRCHLAWLSASINVPDVMRTNSTIDIKGTAVIYRPTCSHDKPVCRVVRSHCTECHSSLYRCTAMTRVMHLCICKRWRTFCRPL